MFSGAYGSSCIFNNMRVGGPDRGGGTGSRTATCAEPISSGGDEVDLLGAFAARSPVPGGRGRTELSLFEVYGTKRSKHISVNRSYPSVLAAKDEPVCRTIADRSTPAGFAEPALDVLVRLASYRSN
jgi:hypothetical protein